MNNLISSKNFIFIILPYLIDYETFLKDRMYVNPTENSKLLEDIKKIRVDIGRMIKRLGE